MPSITHHDSRDREPAGASRPSKAIIVVDHGSVREEANEVLREIGRLVSELAGEGCHVEVAHMEIAEPTIAQAMDACVRAGAGEITVQPYMLAPGRHSAEDIPRLVEKAASRHPQVTVRVADPLGVDRRLAELVLERARAAAAPGNTERRKPRWR